MTSPAKKAATDLDLLAYRLQLARRLCPSRLFPPSAASSGHQKPTTWARHRCRADLRLSFPLHSWSLLPLMRLQTALGQRGGRTYRVAGLEKECSSVGGAPSAVRADGVRWKGVRGEEEAKGPGIDVGARVGVSVHSQTPIKPSKRV